MDYQYSEYLRSQKPIFQRLIRELQQHFTYCSVLVTDSKGISIRVGTQVTSVGDSPLKERGFVVRVYNGVSYAEYSGNTLNDANFLATVDAVLETAQLSKKLAQSEHFQSYVYPLMQEEPLTAHYERLKDREVVNESLIVERLTALKNKCHREPLLINCNLGLEHVIINKMFLSPQRDLEQIYTWTNTMVMGVVRRDQKVQYAYQSYSGVDHVSQLESVEHGAMETIDLAIDLLEAKPVEPGIYDVITSPEITGLIAHEAFGHGVEMDMFVKQRAKAVEFIGKPIASSLVTMHEGALGPENVSSYFFDDEGILAHDTIVIEKGILKTGIADTLSAMQLGIEPTGNGKRQSFERKTYTRMTNTYFEPGHDSLEKMIESIDNGYLVSTMMSGMEDPKNWGIQCVALVGREIKNGRLTGSIVSPVYMTGYVPDLLQSISMVSRDFEIDGGGMCGKGYKEFVKTAGGGPYLKARVALS
jgi:TldD protein